MMFVGTMIFSLVIGIYGEILEKFKLIEEEFDEGSRLSMFMDVIKHFNGNHGLKQQVKDEIEDYFSYRWKKHNHLPFESPEGMRFNGKIPVGGYAQMHLYLGFLYEPFMSVFGRTLSIQVPFKRREIK